VSFKLLHSDAYRADGSFDTRLLRDVNESGQWVQENRGSHTALTLECVGNGTADAHNIRPFVSATTQSAIFRIPWYVAPDLDTLKVGVFNRVSHGYYDAEEGSLPDERVEILTRFAGDQWASPGHAYQSRRSGAEWGWTQLSDYKPSQEYRDDRARYPGYDSLLVGIRSSIEGHLEVGTTPNTTYRAGGDWGVDQGNTGTVIRTNTTSTYSEGSTSNPPAQDANEITVSVLTSVDDEIESVHDHVRRQDRSQNDAMFVWPPVNTTVAAFKWAFVATYWVPYIQFRALEIQELFA
jgi:hypothetical protein